MRVITLFAITTSFIFSCQQSSQSKTQAIAERFIKVSAERKDLEQILSFYSDDFQYENIIFESKTNDPKYLYNTIYAWGDSNYTFPSNKSLEVSDLVCNDSTIIAKGKLLPYLYKGNSVPAMRFIIYLELDKSGKIKKQTDWFNYPMTDILEAWQIKNSMNVE